MVVPKAPDALRSGCFLWLKQQQTVPMLCTLQTGDVQTIDAFCGNHCKIDTPNSSLNITSASSVHFPEMLTLTILSTGFAFAAEIFKVIL